MSGLLGLFVKDVVSGFEGYVTGTVEYLTGCNQVLVQPRGLDKDGKKRDPEWFDDSRVSVVPTVPPLVRVEGTIREASLVGAVPVGRRRDGPGFDKPAPKR